MEEQPIRLKDYQSLLAKAITALDLYEDPDHGEVKGDKSSPKGIKEASIVWAQKLSELIPSDCERALEEASHILKAVTFSAETSLDTRTFAACSMAAAANVRLGLSLRVWQADLHFKLIMMTYSFEGGRLFEDKLDKSLVESRDKKRPILRDLQKQDKGNRVLPASFAQEPIPYF
uniref:Uncharacterized protein n=1 Tax=Sphaerodactylus townsendi TaxID=933632 RepID=A0ACB8ESE0_9SAUR